MAQPKSVTASMAGSPGKCPICGRATETDYRPFCSRRCADIDLSRWLRGTYAIPETADSDEDGDSPVPPGGADKDDGSSSH